MPKSNFKAEEGPFLFTKPDCKNCDYVKDKIPDGLEITIKDISQPEGLAYAAYYELIDANVPILIENGHRVDGTIKIVNHMKEMSG